MALEVITPPILLAAVAAELFLVRLHHMGVLVPGDVLLARRDVATQSAGELGSVSELDRAGWL